MATSPEHSAKTETAGQHGGGGLPQFEFQYWSGQIVWLLLIFSLLYVLLGRVFVPRLRKVIDARAAAIADALAAARRVQAEADLESQAAERGLTQARAAAQRTAAEAKAKAQAEAAARRQVEDAALDEKMVAAEAQIRSKREAAMANVGEVASEAVVAILEKLTGQPTKADDVIAALVRRNLPEGTA